MKKSISMLAIGLAASCMLSCEQDEEVVQPIQEDAQTNEEAYVDVTIDAETGEPVATNFNDVEFITTEGVKERDLSNARTIGQINDEELWRLGTEFNHSLEIFAYLPTGHVLTGIGLRVYDAIVTTMVIESRYLYPDGSLGPRERSFHGINKYHPLEVWYSVPDLTVITGLGFRVRNDNVTTMEVTYNYVDKSSPSLDDVLIHDYQNVKRVGTVPNHSLEVQFDTGRLGPLQSKTVLNGVGFRCDDDNMTTMWLVVGYLKPTTR